VAKAREEAQVPDTLGAPQEAAPRIGVDEWAAQAEGRSERYAGAAGRLRRTLDRLPPWFYLAVFLALATPIPMVVSSEYVVRVGVDTMLYVLLALGLNIVVGWAGLLDLGYIAFYGFGAYSYAFLSSDQFGIHWPAEVTIPLVVVATALLGLLLGLPSRRLLGDYLAIVTLFFFQIFITLATNADRIKLPGMERARNITNGPNGIADIDPMRFFRWELVSIRAYYWLALGMFAAIAVLLFLLNDSRTGRAWRSVREDPLAAELMGMPVNWLKLMAFAFGAATAGLSGTIFAAVQTGVFPTNFDLALLITIYAMVILGGAGSLAGPVLGALTINLTLEALAPDNYPREIFYALLLVALLAFVRPWRWLPVVLVGTVLFGFAVHAVVERAWPDGTAGRPRGTGALSHLADAWVVIPKDPGNLAKYAYVLLIACVLGLTLVRGIARTLALVPVSYLAVLVWENLLGRELNISVTRLILLGALLVALMNARPQGLLGTPRVEII
jgi:ABC-type branched-subunit amino acid transport system permease subunit